MMWVVVVVMVVVVMVMDRTNSQCREVKRKLALKMVVMMNLIMIVKGGDRCRWFRW